jgi:hypothetical protein
MFAAHIVVRWIVHVRSLPVVVFAEVVVTSEHEVAAELPVQLNTQVSQGPRMDMAVDPLSLVERTKTNNSLHCCMDCGLEVAPYQTIFVLQMVEKPVVQTVLATDANVEKVPAEPA